MAIKVSATDKSEIPHERIYPPNYTPQEISDHLAEIRKQLDPEIQKLREKEARSWVRASNKVLN